MVYKKYIKRDGKVFGPYYYESYRENGKVKTRFVSGPKKGDVVGDKIKSMRNYFIFGFLILLITGMFGLALYYSDKISERIYGTGLLSPPYGDGTSENQMSEKEKVVFEKDIKETINSYDFNKLSEEEVVTLDGGKKVELKRISDTELEVYDAEKKVLIAKIRVGKNKVDVEFSF